MPRATREEETTSDPLPLSFLTRGYFGAFNVQSIHQRRRKDCGGQAIKGTTTLKLMFYGQKKDS